ncbi:MAG: tetratricopeptide repeat protein [Candidatus Eisenbacteria bacterium]|uniref:Tetratricopeptide repeat protein n=1 Tax=Eiseniibacteriota bacterium TaxID=2212470 RepID=A0A948S301_UNCEI|nr:tetratricopeptide repeat protein [Candidatus Eisenbacteria bacterium]
MMQERDLLVKQVFPELRRICERRFVTFTEVDMRWGITEEQAAEGKVLPLCLTEIHHCRPYFIGLLGERYGWIPDTIPADVIKSEPWLKEHLNARTSVTELEILHGVLNNPAMQTHAFFYFRDPKWIESLTDAERREMIERDIPIDVEYYGIKEASRRTQERKDKLVALKDRIHQSGLPVIEDYASPEALAKIIREQFKELIDRLFPEEDVPDDLDRERLTHEAHAKSKLFACIKRPSHLAALHKFADSEHGGKGLVVTGDSGSGKTVLLADWARERANSHPDGFLFQHYFGSTPDSASVRNFLRRLLAEIKRRFDIEEDIPTEPEKLREALPLWLAQTTGRGQIVLVMDGLNQVQGDEPDRRLFWLPRFFQPHVIVIASSLPGLALDAIHERDWHEHDLPLADENEIEDIVEAYLDEYRKTLDPELRRDLVKAPGSMNPLFLRTVLDELRQFGSFEKLPARVAHYLEADNPGDLFRRVICRWQEDFDNEQDLVRCALTYLWGARMGLSESEWLDLLGEDMGSLPRAIWTPLFLAMEPHLTRRTGLLAFGHDFLRQAVAAEFLQADSDRHSAHLELAAYFAAQPEMTPRKSDEWPWQLQEAEEWDCLQQALTDRELFLALYKQQTDVELGRYWVRLRENRPEIRMGKLYHEAFASWEVGNEPSQNGVLAGQLWMYLHDNACFKESEPLAHRALEINEKICGPNHPKVATDLNNLAQVLCSTNRHSEAEPLLRRASEIDEKFYGQDHPDVAIRLGNLAVLLKRTKRLSEAEPLQRRALEIFEKVLGKNHPKSAMMLNNLATLLQDTNRHSEAEIAMRRALEIFKKALGEDHPNVALVQNNLAQLLGDTNRHSEAEPLLRRSLKILEKALGENHPYVAGSLNNLGLSLVNTHRFSDAEPLYQRALKINEQSYGPNDPRVAICLNNLAQSLRATNHHSEAEPFMRRALKIKEQSHGPNDPEVAVCLSNLAQSLQATNRHSEAEPLIRKAITINQQLYGPNDPKVAICLNNLAQLLQVTNRLSEAEPLLRRSLEILENALGADHPNVASVLNNLAQLLCGTNRRTEAEPLLRRSLEILEKALGENDPEIASPLSYLGLILQARNCHSEAEPLLRRALQILIQHTRVTGYPHPHLKTAGNNYARLLQAMGRSLKDILADLQAIAPEIFDSNSS